MERINKESEIHKVKKIVFHNFISFLGAGLIELIVKYLLGISSKMKTWGFRNDFTQKKTQKNKKQ